MPHQEQSQKRPETQSNDWEERYRQLFKAFKNKQEECEQYQQDLDEALTKLVDNDDAIDRLNKENAELR